MSLTKKELKKILFSILIGATTAFITTFLEGLIDFLRGYGNNIVGGITTSIAYTIKTWHKII